ncbi:MAG: gliding motility-associated C-terminal domain-containing protein [Bacteroidales bacterium]|nr:gliding motility-associated C-terminal domain-containing protein [Bacteroidales bacterium]
MHKLLTLFPIIFLFLLFTPRQLNAQVDTVETELPESITICYHSITAIPVVVHTMKNVDTLRLVLSFDNSVVDYVEYFALNSVLTGGIFDIKNENDSIIISWTRSNSATIISDTLVWLKFIGLIGSTPLHWNTPGSFYHTSTGNIPAVFKDGKAFVNPKINVVLTELTATCTGACSANYKAEASGGTAPYIYKWNGKASQWDNIQKYLCSGNMNHISIIDSVGCGLDSAYIINGLPGASVKLIIKDNVGDTTTAIYIENPTLTFSFDEISPTHIVEAPMWYFGDGDTAVLFNPTHVYEKAITNTDGFYDLILNIVNENGCDSTLIVRIPIKDAKLKIPNVITPNGDGQNEKFLIMNESKSGSGEDIKITNEFQSMQLVIFDRWGRKVYESNNYKSDWIAAGVPDGSYYYILKTIGFYHTEIHKGSITVLGSGISQ